MGYECPVCSTPQADARHLANHMAIVAMMGREDHRSWLDEHTPGWADAGEAELAPRVAEHATEKEFPQVFEDTVGGLEEGEDPDDPLAERGGALFEDAEGIPHGHDHGGDHPHQHTPQEAHLAGEGVDAEHLDEETRAVLEEAREMTRTMLGAEDERSESSDGASGDAASHDETDEGDDADAAPAASDSEDESGEPSERASDADNNA
jgi:hypothetical protein